MRRSEIAISVIVLIALAIGIFFYDSMPARMASHWNIRGQVDGYVPKFWGLFLMPLVLAGLALLFFAIPKIDPLKENIEAFRKYYDGFVILLSIFMFVVYLQGVLWNLGTRVSPNVILPIGVGILFFYAGILMENSKRNWFIGIRTPWTLSSDRVWERTHNIGGKLFKVAGVVSLIGAFFQDYAVFFILVPVMVVAAYTIAYSYLEYRKEKK